MGRTTTVDLGDLKGFVDELIASGDYNTQSEVIRESVRLLKEKHARSKLTELRRLIDEGDNSGPPVDFNLDSFLARIKRRSNAD